MSLYMTFFILKAFLSPFCVSRVGLSKSYDYEEVFNAMRTSVHGGAGGRGGS